MSKLVVYKPDKEPLNPHACFHWLGQIIILYLFATGSDHYHYQHIETNRPPACSCNIVTPCCHLATDSTIGRIVYYSSYVKQMAPSYKTHFNETCTVVMTLKDGHCCTFGRIFQSRSCVGCQIQAAYVPTVAYG